MLTKSSRTYCASLCVAALTACGSAPSPENLPPVKTGEAYQAQYRDPQTSGSEPVLMSEQMNAASCRPYLGLTGDGAGKGGALAAASLRGERLSRNDLIDVRIGEDDTFNGSYVVSRDGLLKLPFLPAVRAQGRSPSQIEADLAQFLVEDGFYTSAPRISVRVADYASVSVAVSGAVFEPHGVEIGGKSADQIDSARQAALGASTEARNLSAALRSAGGVRPDADLSAITLYRGGQKYQLDLTGVFQGRNMVDVMLLSGDEVVVPSRLCFQDGLMRPSPVSPPGVSLFMSNLTQPATSNASSAIGRSVREVPYGTRFMQAVFDTNCVGGVRATSAHRSALLFTRDPITGVSIVIERSIEDQLRRADRDDYDPYVLPGDSIACYDSGVTNVADVARVLGLVGVGPR
ncbi:polysaccharide biosynthesis/export family protein [Actibacterium pelagium]|uniref:Polysaccharide biosynthesis protein n=1 Tax=Actibacterium pelagium TaxID=2029103 RepID=A0A917ANL7_9RHOB|nr:polysaccharide biosynthesis/export family protein [Actibacterium pelagium]GGE62451.1 hypothetical protein GCM10011517_32710 [Actibacterium pelagium]